MTQVELLNMTFKWFLLIRTKSTFQSVVLYLIKNAECIKFYLKWKYNDSNRSVECIKNATWHLFYLEKKRFGFPVPAVSVILRNSLCLCMFAVHCTNTCAQSFAQKAYVRLKLISLLLLSCPYACTIWKHTA